MIRQQPGGASLREIASRVSLAAGADMTKLTYVLLRVTKRVLKENEVPTHVLLPIGRFPQTNGPADWPVPGQDLAGPGSSLAKRSKSLRRPSGTRIAIRRAHDDAIDVAIFIFAALARCGCLRERRRLGGRARCDAPCAQGTFRGAGDRPDGGR